MKRVAVIGAGASGLPAIKCCLDEGLQPVCFERTDDIGGLWNYTPDVREGQGSVMKSTITNTSKEMTTYSDFPPPRGFPMYPHNRQMLQYFRMYADKFGLRPYIRFKTEIVSVKPVQEEKESKWTVVSKDGSTGKLTTETFDNVMVCCGHYKDKFVPNVPGQNAFQGKLIHSHDYRDFHGFEDKKVVVVGIGNSGGDAAVELSRVASKVYLSTRDGRYILGRISEAGMPVDMIHLTRFRRGALSYLPRSLIETLYLKKLNQTVNHQAYCLETDSGPFAKGVLVNDELPSRIACGSIVIKAGVKRLHKTSVEFDDGTTECDVDVILLATGYTFDYPFLHSSVHGLSANRNTLYKFMFPPVSTQPTICVIGLIQAAGPSPPMAEMQARLALAVFKGKVKLPSVELQQADIEKTRSRLKKVFSDSKGHFFTVDYMVYMDELASLFGCKPALVKMFLTDTKLAWLCLFGACTPYQYRLEGPGKWSGAREAILQQWDRTLAPLQTRPTTRKQNSSNIIIVMKVSVVFIGLYYLYSKYALKNLDQVI
ncbi:dimethylaniline monooxygenase [N-oxide-forming] 5-like [Mizuhopecten yessoensis]|uniref:Flavin-containing monooxygenase n=1 Tax=Mizuhopecten yessoensis TaxID=6573 RepID=A0A210Q1L8_MIZYE|nr:dimethylaniline monooxygenase [N-oxide-forming] 5-like [Mizuhopecten yessoensis]OWF42643.1 Dimethylaniline monooxygenase [N-oxide-forming] 2 [Mizuhopecten yessoensis]